MSKDKSSKGHLTVTYSFIVWCGVKCPPHYVHYLASPPICEMHIRDQTSLISVLLLTQFIVDTKVPIWVGLAKKGVLKG